MKWAAMFWASFLLLVPGSGNAETITIRNDIGGDLGFYEVRLGVYESLGIKVRIDGICASACTILTRLPSNLICATERAELRFHKIRPVSTATVSQASVDRENSRLLALYPAEIQSWIGTHGGLTDEILAMHPRAIAHYLRPCLPDAGSVIANTGYQTAR